MKLISINEASEILKLSPKILRRLVLKNKFDFLYVNGIRKYDYDCIINLSPYEKKKRNYWTKEKCAEEALKYKNRKEFQIHNKGSYLTALRKGWLEDICKHMNRPVNHNKIWYKGNCKEEALKYKTRNDFQNYSRGAYKAVVANQWLDEICQHMILLRMPNNFWTKELVIKEVLKYNTRQEFRKSSHSAYHAASINDWLNEVCQHMEKCGNLLLRCVYAYEFSDNYVYVGLTCNDSRRQIEHLMKLKSPVARHIAETNITPKHIILSNDYIDVYSAQQLEKESYNDYVSKGWYMLNSNRTGGVGSQKLPKNKIN
jgi:hypothetical protein